MAAVTKQHSVFWGAEADHRIPGLQARGGQGWLPWRPADSLCPRIQLPAAGSWCPRPRDCPCLQPAS